VAGALVKLGCRHALVVSGEDGVDEVSISGDTRVIEVTQDGTRNYTVDPEQAGLERAACEAVIGGAPERNAEIVRQILEGEGGPCRDLAVINAAAALVAVEKASTLEEGAELAKEA